MADFSWMNVSKRDTSWIGISVTDNDRIARILSRFPKEIGDAGADAIAEYVIKIYKHYPKKKHVSRAMAFPNAFAVSPNGKIIPGFQSWRQFKFVMALYGEGKIPYKRTQRLRNAWNQVGTGQKSIIVNETPYAALVMGDLVDQTNQMSMIGWRQYDLVFEDHKEKIDKVLFGAVKKQIRKMGLKTD